MFNCFTLSGWKVFPAASCKVESPVSFFMCFCLHFGFSLTMEAYEVSTFLLRNHWPREITQAALANFVITEWKKTHHRPCPTWGIYGRPSQLHVHEARRILKSQRTIVFRSGGMANLNKEARMAFFSHVTIHSLNVLVLFRTAMKHGLEEIRYNPT